MGRKHSMKATTNHCARRVAAITGALSFATCALLAQAPSTTREAWLRPDDIVAALGIRPGSRVAEVGAGTGFFIARLSRAVGPDGRVLAVDVPQKMLDQLKQLAEKEGLSNVDVIRGELNDPRLDANSLDAVLIVNAYHEIPEHAAMLGHIRKALRPNGRLVIVEPIRELASEYVVTELRAAGFRVERLDASFARNPVTSEMTWIIVAVPDPRMPPR
jgi:ubiquinone/menaquinone biosynthesis C-methylase UbiE